MLEDAIRELATGPNYAALSVLTAHGGPMTHIMWVDADDEHLLINTEVHRAKFANIERDPRVAVAIFDAANPYHYAEVRGRVIETVRGAEAREHIDKLAHKYRGTAYDAPIQSERVILRIAPERQRVQ